MPVWVIHFVDSKFSNNFSSNNNFNCVHYFKSSGIKFIIPNNFSILQQNQTNQDEDLYCVMGCNNAISRHFKWLSGKHAITIAFLFVISEIEASFCNFRSSPSEVYWKWIDWALNLKFKFWTMSFFFILRKSGGSTRSGLSCRFLNGHLIVVRVADPS